MFGHKKRKNIKKIRKEVTRLRQLEEAKHGKKDQMPLGWYVAFVIVVGIIAFNHFSSDSNSDSLTISSQSKSPVVSSSINRKPSISSETTNSISEDSNQRAQEQAVKKESMQEVDPRISDNYSKMTSAGLSDSQIDSLSSVLNEKNWTLKSISKKSNWAKGSRYLITVGWGYDYIVYFDKEDIQSINNMDNQVVYGSRATY